MIPEVLIVQFIMRVCIKKKCSHVLSRAGRYQEVHPKGFASKAPSPLKVKELWHKGRRYLICLNEDQAKRDALVREAVIESLREKLRN